MDNYTYNIIKTVKTNIGMCAALSHIMIKQKYDKSGDCCWDYFL